MTYITITFKAEIQKKTTLLTTQSRGDLLAIRTKPPGVVYNDDDAIDDNSSVFKRQLLLITSLSLM